MSFSTKFGTGAGSMPKIGSQPGISSAIAGTGGKKKLGNVKGMSAKGPRRSRLKEFIGP